MKSFSQIALELLLKGIIPYMLNKYFLTGFIKNEEETSIIPYFTDKDFKKIPWRGYPVTDWWW